MLMWPWEWLVRRVMGREDRRLAREKRTVSAMVQIACRGRHGSENGLCLECERLLDYALDRLAACPFQASKPTCARCRVHCYRPSSRRRIKTVMRYAGPRMLFWHPWLTLCHLVDGLRGPLAREASGEDDERRERPSADHRKV